MFWRKKKPENADMPAQDAAPRRGIMARAFRILGKLCKYVSILLLVCLLALACGAYWLTQTESGLDFIVKTANSQLGPQPGREGLAFRITSLQGSIPASFNFGLEIYDGHGLWLAAPQNSFALDWRHLPKAVVISLIAANDIDLRRFPDLPAQPPPPPSKPLEMADIRAMLAQASDFLTQEHWWLPQIRIAEIQMRNARLPEALLPAPDKKPQRLAANMAASMEFANGQASVSVNADARNALGEYLAAPSVTLAALAANVTAKAGPAPDGLFGNIHIDANVDGPRVDAADLPPGFIGAKPVLSLDIAANAVTTPQKEALSVTLSGPNLDAGHVGVKAGGQWESGDSWSKGEIGGPLRYSLDLALAPIAEDSPCPLAAVRAPARLDLELNGHLPMLNARAGLACAEIVQSGHAITGAGLTLAASNVELPLNKADSLALEDENNVRFKLSAKVDNHPLTMAADIFFQALSEGQGHASGWRAGLRNLAIDALGLRGDGNLAALLPEGGKPAIDGAINLALRDWKDIEALVPGRKFAGQVNVAATLASGAPAPLGNAAEVIPRISLHRNLRLRQQVDAKISIPSLSVKSAEGGAPIELAGVEGAAKLADVFGDMAIDAKADARKIAAAGMKLSARIGASGPLSGPLKADVEAKGDVGGRVAAQWRPGHVRIDALEILADVGRFLPLEKGKKLMAGIRSAQTAEITYGANGIGASNVDLRMLPSGRLTANGAIAPNKLDFRLNLDNLQLKPLQAISGAIPSGIVNMAASLSGAPARPAGAFQLGLKEIAIPKSPLAPLSVAIDGKIEHGRANASALHLNVALDPKTVKTLGGNTAAISATLPLVFGADGVPKPDMKGPLAAKVRWDGALGPIWNLLPIADQRLNGRIEADIAASGSLEAPKVNGFAAVNKARYENVGVGALLTDINARVDLADAGMGAGGLAGAVKVALSLSDGRGGSVTGNGGGALTGKDLDIRIKIDKLKPLRRRDVHVQLSGNVNVTGSAAAPVVGGEIIVDRGEVLLNNIVMTGSVTTLPITDPSADAQKAASGADKKPEVKKASAKPGARPKAKKAEQAKIASAQSGPDAMAAPAAAGVGSLNLRVRMLPRFTVEGRGLASTWQANLLIFGPLNDPHVNGNISCVRGNLDFLGKNFALTRGVVFFGGGSLANPLLDIELTNETPDLTAHILITGPVSKIRLQLTSDPTVPRDEILSRVLFGRSVNDLSRAEALQLAGAVAQLAGFGGGNILDPAKKALGVDVLRLGTSDTGATGQDNGGGTNIEMGKYLNDFTYVGVQQGFKPDSTAFIIEIELGSHTNLELRTEQNNTWGGIKWKYNY